MKPIKNFTVGALLMLVIVVVFQNTETVETRLLFWSISMPRALLLALTLLSGVVIGLLLGIKFPGFSKKG